ncbi:hypothetical protein Golax_003709 [Gossypium laxum]|uniref:Uncharacterized protein n=1 Tax=Gossypium laxum TaxID=34288 RepID=A0A7J9AGI4_9ROSI|nr:hypothetical protein [Gossypium laxum]
MEESIGNDREGRDEISLLAKELIQLSVKGSMVVPNPKPTLICTVWTEKLYNPESFRAQMKSSCLLEFDKKDLLHAIGVMFGGVLRYEISRDSCRLKIKLISRMGHGLKDCLQIIPAGKSKISDDPPYTLALKAESKLIGKESMKFNVLSKKVGAQCSYTGGIELLPNSSKIIVGGNNEIWRLHGNMELMGGEEVLMEQESISVVKEDEKLNDSTKKYGNNSNLVKKESWKRIKLVATMIQTKAESNTRKRKSPEA